MNKIVRESRHIWVGNLPENVREEQIQDYFSRFGRVEKVKLLTKSSPDGGKAAFVDFVDIRSATKANEAQNRMGDRDLRTNYNEPGGNKVQDFGRGVPAVRTYGNYPPAPGIPYRGQPVVIYAAPPPGAHIIRTAATYPIHPRDERKVIAPYQPRRERGRSPVSRGSASDDDHSVSPTRRPTRGTADNSSDSDASSGKFIKRTTIIVQNLVARNSATGHLNLKNSHQTMPFGLIEIEDGGREQMTHVIQEDSSLEEALYYEFKKYGAILNIVIKAAGPDRHAYIKFMKAEAAEEALAVSGKLFLGQEMKIVLKGGGGSTKRRSSKGGAPPPPPSVGAVVVSGGGGSGGAVDLEFDPHATRTVFIGNLEKTTSHGELRGIFEHFGDVVDVDIKKMQTGLTTYAFIQYIDIDGAMRAKRKMDRQYIGQNRLKVGYGRGTPTNSLWVGNLPVSVAEHQISKAFHPFGYVQRTLIDKQYWQALVRFETIEACTRAFAEMHGKQLLGKRLLVDYASPSCRDGYYSRMERNGLLDRHQLEPSPTPPDAHINFQNPARTGGRFQPRGAAFTTPPIPGVGNPPFSPPRETPRVYEHDRTYLERKSEYDKDLREYGAARDKYRGGRRSLSRDVSLSPKRRRSRDSVSPVSSVGLYGDRKVKVKKEKKRKRQADDSPLMNNDEPISKKKKKEKKKEKKEKAKKEKAVKGSIDLGYMNEEEDSKPNRDVSPPPPAMKSKMEMKKEKKERKRAEKAEKERKKAEKKQKKLAKKKDAEESMNNSVNNNNSSNTNNVSADVAENSTATIVVKQESNGVIDGENINDKPAVESAASNEPETKAAEKTEITNGVSDTADKPVTENGTDEAAAIKLENSEDAATSESKTNETNESSEPKVNGTPTKSGAPKTDKDSNVATIDNNDTTSSNNNTETKNTDNNDSIRNSNSNNNNKVNEHKRVINNHKRRKSTGDKKAREDSSDSSSSSSSSSSESDDSDDSSDDDDDKDPKHRGYRHPKDRHHRKSMSSHDKNNDMKSREPKAYRQGSLSDYPRDSLRDRSVDRDRDYKFKYSSDGRKRSPSSERDRRRPSSITSKPPRGRSNSPLRRSPLASDRARSRSPFERRRGRSPLRTKPTDRMDRKEMSHSSRNDRDRTPPPPPREIQKPVETHQALSYPPKPVAIGNPAYSTPSATGAENPDTLLDLLRRFPVMWQGLLGLKNDTAAVQMHFLSGNVNLAEQSLPRGAQPHDVPPPLRISQRMKLEPSQLEGVDKRIQHQKEHCMLLALPCGRDPLDVHAQTRALKTGFITYLQQKQAAGIINVASPQTKTAAYVVHIFPPCEFAQGHLARVAPDLLNSAADSGHLMVLITPL